MNPQTDEVNWQVTKLISALENWGRHHGWCPALQNGKVVNELACKCGFSEAKQPPNVIAQNDTPKPTAEVRPVVKKAPVVAENNDINVHQYQPPKS